MKKRFPIFILPCFALIQISSAFAPARQPKAWRDPSTHKVQFITVEKDVHLEVLDWGGAGRRVVLLAGSGNTAHGYDEFAAKLTAFCHPYAITRRGYGASSHPSSGYTEQRLAEDVLRVLDGLKLQTPVIVGHSMSGEELTRLGSEHPERLGGLVYLDALFDPADSPASSPAYLELFNKLPEGRRADPKPSKTDRESFRAYREWQMRNGKAPFPESELRNMYATNPDGWVGDYKASTDEIHKAIGDGSKNGIIRGSRYRSYRFSRGRAQRRLRARTFVQRSHTTIPSIRPKSLTCQRMLRSAPRLVHLMTPLSRMRIAGTRNFSPRRVGWVWWTYREQITNPLSATSKKY